MNHNRKLCIILNNSSQIFNKEGHVSGNVVIHANGVEETNGIKIVFFGSISCKWKETVLSTNQRHTSVDKTLTAFGKLFDYRIDLLNNEGHTVKLQPGYHTYPFEFQVPDGVPSSFNGSKGKVEYTLTAEMIRPLFRLDKKHKLTVNVQGYLDLNTHPTAGVPISFQMQNNFYGSGPAKLLFKVSKRGFAPGEEVPVVFEIDNQSSKTLKKCRLSLFQVVTYNVELHQKTREGKIILCYTEPVVKGEQRTISKNVKVPSSVTTNLSAVPPQIIRVQYYLQLKMVFPNRRNNVAKCIPVIIGTVPITTMAAPTVPTSVTINSQSFAEESMGRFSRSSSQISNYSDNGQSLDNLSISSEISLPPAYETLEDLPPSYAEAMLLELRQNN